MREAINIVAGNMDERVLHSNSVALDHFASTRSNEIECPALFDHHL